MLKPVFLRMFKYTPCSDSSMLHTKLKKLVVVRAAEKVQRILVHSAADFCSHTSKLLLHDTGCVVLVCSHP
jgi:hypothetical protein